MASPPESRSISIIRCCGLISESEVTGVSGCSSFHARICDHQAGARAAGCRYRVGAWFPTVPCSAAEHALHVAHDRHIGGAVLADFRGIDIHVNHLRVRRESGQPSGHAIVEAHAQGDDQVAAVIAMLAA